MGAALATTVMVTARSRKQTAKLIEQVYLANVEHPNRPLSVSFSPDYPALSDAYRTDFWVRVAPNNTEVLMFHPGNRRWEDAAVSYGVGYGFIDGKMISFRSVPTTMSEALIQRLSRAADERDIPPDLLSELSLRDPNEVFAVIEALGFVRQFNTALERLNFGTPLHAIFGVPAARPLDI